MPAPSIPDLNPLDFSLWCILETEACSKFGSSEASAWYEIPQETLRIAVKSVPTRLRTVIKKKGGYIE